MVIVSVLVTLRRLSLQLVYRFVQVLNEHSEELFVVCCIPNGTLREIDLSIDLRSILLDKQRRPNGCNYLFPLLTVLFFPLVTSLINLVDLVI